MSEPTLDAVTEPVHTGVSLVDSILESVDAATGLPLEDQVGVFERAHEQLRRALDAPDSQLDDQPESD
ncbi:hypothetical protein [Nocardioides sp. Kera G14]|uniref:hypothetical protein n=1 Tax=Nocardioides sp. Kera G14 TaxID=2884264 RepID=UPI001D0FB61D|nr:hypothetical protein [Nocardioides sp. Kera G14]UDY25274.1 hypothetical protein LH076_08310 [Nocardioides sp. Kera G14]